MRFPGEEDRSFGPCDDRDPAAEWAEAVARNERIVSIGEARRNRLRLQGMMPPEVRGGLHGPALDPNEAMIERYEADEQRIQDAAADRDAARYEAAQTETRAAGELASGRRLTGAEAMRQLESLRIKFTPVVDG